MGGIEFEILQYAFMQRALATGVVTALVCGVISCWITHMGWSLMGDAISHAILPGVVLAHIVGIPYVVGALAFALVTVALVGQVKKSRVIKPDTAIGIVFTAFFALGTVLISKVPSQINLSHILFGNLLGVTVADMQQVLFVGMPILAILLLKRRDLTLIAFDSSHAQAMGIPVRFLSGLLLVALALAIIISLQAVGVILSVSLLIVPGATARLISDDMKHMLWISPLVAMISVVAGIVLSYLFDASSGGMIGLVLGVAFGIVYLFGPHGAAWQAQGGTGLSQKGARSSSTPVHDSPTG